MMLVHQKRPSGKKKPPHPSPNNGITLIEIMFICMILAVFTAICIRIYLILTAPTIPDQTNPRILIIENAMKFYKLDNGFYPTTAQGISALIVKPSTQPIPQHWTNYLKSMPLDRCGKPYHYDNPGKKNEIDIYSDCATL